MASSDFNTGTPSEAALLRPRLSTLSAPEYSVPRNASTVRINQAAPGELAAERSPSSQNNMPLTAASGASVRSRLINAPQPEENTTPVSNRRYRFHSPPRKLKPNTANTATSAPASPAS